MTAKIARMRLNGRRLRVYETGISYAGRTYEEGKKSQLERRRIGHFPDHPFPVNGLVFL